jgi:membrane protein implicated in regulation of membrane protease activity
MHIVALGWMFVVLLMTAAEATSTQGTLLGAFFTLLLYGVLPLSIVLYVLATPARRRLRRRAEAQADAASAASSAAAPGDGRGHAASAAVAAEREEP